MNERRSTTVEARIGIPPAALHASEEAVFGHLDDRMSGFEEEWKTELPEGINPNHLITTIEDHYQTSSVTPFRLFGSPMLHTTTVVTKHRDALRKFSRLDRDDGEEVGKIKWQGREINGVTIRPERKDFIESDDDWENETDGATYKGRMRREKWAIALLHETSGNVYVVSADERVWEDPADGEPLPNRVQVEYKGTDPTRNGNGDSLSAETNLERLADDIALEIGMIRDEIQEFIPRGRAAGAE